MEPPDFRQVMATGCVSRVATDETPISWQLHGLVTDPCLLVFADRTVHRMAAAARVRNRATGRSITVAPPAASRERLETS